MFARSSFCRFANPTKLQKIMHYCQPFDNTNTSAGDYTATPWPSFSTVMPNARIDGTLAAGFDGIRLTFHPGPLLKAASDAVLDIRIAILTSSVTTMIGRGAKVIFGMFPVAPGGPFDDGMGYTNISVLTGGVNGANFQRYIYCAARLGAALEALNKPGAILFELFNQPPLTPNITDDTWPNYQNALFTAVRAVAPRLTLGVAGSNGSSYDGIGTGSTTSAGLNQLTLSNYDLNTVLCAQNYDMTQTFNMQHTAGELNECQGLFWPASAHPGGITAAKASWTAALDAALAGATITQQQHDDRLSQLVNGTSHSRCLTRYFNEFGAKTGLTASLDQRLKIITDKMDTASWSRRQLGSTEMAVNFQFSNCAPHASTMQWMQDWVDTMDAAGSNFISIFLGGGVNETLINGTEGSIVQSGVSPYAFESGFLDAMRLT